MQKPMARRQTTEDSEDEADDERYEQGRIETKKGVEVSVIKDFSNSSWKICFFKPSFFLSKVFNLFIRDSPCPHDRLTELVLAP